MERETAVYVDLAGAAVPVGTLRTRTRGARQTASFEYAASWLARPGAFGIDPALPPARGPFHTDRPLFNAFTDPAPDRWGQNLLRRNERRQAGVERRQPRTLQAIDYLTLVDDRTRLGALRFRDAGAEGGGSGAGFLTTGDRPVPPVDVKPRVHALALDDFDGAASLDTVLAVAPRFGMTGRDARAALAEVGRAVSGWRDAAARYGLTPADVERMASAFDHRDARIAAAGP